MRNALLGAVVLLACACGAYQFPGSSPTPAGGTVSGHVLSVPCAPVERAGDTCAGRPVAGVEIDFRDGSDSRAAVTTSTGAYSIELTSGTWKVQIKTYMRLISGPTSVSVGPGSNVPANYVLDNGIRVPVPQQ
ncbi:MAG TPA: hypothetical protein VGN08_00005 [Solirubrobacteraceae bacterium]